MSDWVDLTEQEAVAKAIRNASWANIRPTVHCQNASPPSRDYAESLPLTPFQLRIAEVAIETVDSFRAASS